MTNKYGIIAQTKPQFPARELLRVPHKKGDLIVGFPAFGSNTYKGNLQSMSGSYSHPVTGERISFTPATTSESISAVAYDFGNMAKPQIFDPRWLQAGYIVRTQNGVFTNTTETDETRLKQLLNGVEKVNGIYLLENGVGFAPYKSFERGEQDCDTFAQGGLARVLEHTHEKTATDLREIASPKFYKKGVNVLGFNEVKKPVLKVASLVPSGLLDRDRLLVCGDWGGGDVGFAFGVLNKNETH